MRPWPLLLVAASSDARCGCDRRVIVATTVNGVRTASLLVPSAARVGAALVVYHEDSADAAAGLEPTEPRARRDAPACFVEAAGCYAAHDLHVLYPWLAAFADAQDPTEGPATVFGRAYANAVARRGAPRPLLTKRATASISAIKPAMHAIVATSVCVSQDECGAMASFLRCLRSMRNRLSGPTGSGGTSHATSIARSLHFRKAETSIPAHTARNTPHFVSVVFCARSARNAQSPPRTADASAT